MDIDRVVEVLVQLLDNAAKYSLPESPIHISAELQNNCVITSIADHGPEESEMLRYCATSVLTSLVLILPGAAGAQTAEKPDLKKQPTLYVVGYAHLDTEWRWEYPQVINEYIRKTMEDNFTLFEKYPHYVFNFSGANRYRFMKEYFPADFERVKKYVDSGR